MIKDLTPLEVFYKGKRILAKYEHDTKDHLIEIDLKQSEWNIIETALKAIEIIKDKVAPLVIFDTYQTPNETKYRVYDNELYSYRPLTKEEYELLKEMLK